MTFANPAGLALLALAIPVLLVHVLRPRRTPVAVSSVLLWQRLERPVSAAQPWQRLRWSLLLLAQLLAVILLAFAVARPQRLEASPLAAHTVFIVDASGSMAATDGAPDRLAAARRQAEALRDQLPEGGIASIVVAGKDARVALTASPDAAEFERALRTIDPFEGRPPFADAFTIAESLDTGTTPIGYVLLSDGGLTAEESGQLPGGTRVERLGSDDTNRGITRLTVEPRGGSLHARVTVRNHGGPRATQTVRVDVDGVTAAAQEVSLAAGEQRDVELDVPSGDLVEAFIGGDDLLAADDHAVAVVGRRTELRVLLAGEALFWDELLASVPGVTIERSETSVRATGYDLAIYDGVAVPTQPGAPFIAVSPPDGLADAGGSGLTVAGSVESPAVTLVRTDDALLAGLDLSDVAIATAQRVEPGDADVLVAGEDAPLLLRGTHGGERFAYVTFALRDSNLPVQLAFPLLADRLVGELTGTGAVGESLEVGDRLPVPPEGAVVTGPDTESRIVEPGGSAPAADQSGFWTITPEAAPAVVVAVNAPASESDVTPADVAVPPAPATGDSAPVRQATSLLPWLLWPLLGLVAIEAVLAWRRVGVGRRQWRTALALRAVVAAMLLLALLDPTLRRPADRVAAVFVLDGSASVGGVGLAEAGRFVDEALDGRDGDSVAGVVVFGADAHVDQVMAALDGYGGATAVVDPSATDISAGVRLGAAVLPNDARRRVVLLSDGRANTGDLDDELAELRERGIPVDVVTLASQQGPDAAIAEVEVPRVARIDERIVVVVHVVASAAGPATVVLGRDGVEVARRVVELAVGVNEARFEDTPGADAGAVVRYQAVVSSIGDGIADNDTGYAAVPIEGPAKVLIVEGSPREAETLTAALEAAGVGSDVVGVGDIPAVHELVTYAGIVLVDVDARTLTGAQIETLSTAVRDLGRGLVTIGGTQSYGVGGYRESPLSDLLPVDSEITDPQRRRTVAEVLSIDTSESMGACHCRDDQMVNPVEEGGVNKTDISRAAAERTIAALADTDQVGVLAWNSNARWVIELQQLPPADVVEDGLRSLEPFGQTDIRDSLGAAAEALIASEAELKHIILFTDGFTDQRLIRATAEEAGRLYAEHGITVSVLATGEGAAPLLEEIAIAGNGRFYAGADLEAVPQIMADEAVIASRNFVTEGEFLPEVTSDDDVVAPLTSAPPLFGYVATTAKGPASTLLRIGPDRDPLLATWQAGLGRVTSWTSDANNWSAAWSGWDGYVEFWSRVVKDTLPAGDDAGAVQATVRDGRIQVSVEQDGAFPDGATATARVSGPDGQASEVVLERTASGRFEGEGDAPRSGSYAVGATVTDAAGAVVVSSSTIASNSYPAEFAPGPADSAALTRVASATGGRTEVVPGDVWDEAGLAAGSRLLHLLGPLMLAAAVLFPIAVVLSLISLRGASVAGARAGVTAAAGSFGRRARRALPRLGALDPTEAPTPPPAPAPPPTTLPPPPPPPPASHEPEAPTPAPARSSTVRDLLAGKRQRQRDR